MPIYALDDVIPQLEEGAWVAPDANIIGKVVLEENASVWFGCTLRGDNEPIVVGQGSNVQENTVMHTDPGFPLTIGRGSKTARPSRKSSTPAAPGNFTTVVRTRRTGRFPWARPVSAGETFP